MLNENLLQCVGGGVPGSREFMEIPIFQGFWRQTSYLKRTTWFLSDFSDFVSKIFVFKANLFE